MARNLLISILGALAPLFAAFFCIPILIDSIGAESFGLLSIVWMVIGYFSIFDLGLGKSLTKRIAELFAQGKLASVPESIFTAQVVLFGMGCVSALAVFLLANVISESLLDLHGERLTESREVIKVLSISLPFVLLSAGYKGALEAFSRFDYVNYVRIPMGVWMFAGPIIALNYSQSLVVVVAFLVFGRVVTAAAYFIFLRFVVSNFGSGKFSRTELVCLVRFGGWLTVSNVISPIMVYMDRFFVGGMLGLAAVAYYTTPYEMVFKLNFLPEAIFSVVFPMMVRASVHNDEKKFLMNYASGAMILAVYVPVLFFISYFASEILFFWVGAEFGEKSSEVLKLLGLGLAINGLAKVDAHGLQANSKAHVTAVINAIEVPFYVLSIFLLTSNFGIVGTAVAWALRMVVDMVLMLGASRKYKIVDDAYVKQRVVSVVLVMALFFLTALDFSIYLSVLVFVCSVAFYLLFVWFVLTPAVLRSAVISKIRFF